MQAFHNDPKVQSKYLNRVKAHALADEIIQGKYWGNGKGCSIGCTIHSSLHSSYESKLGIPQWLAKIEDRLFEGMPNERAKTFPLEFLEAVNLGADLSKILIPMLIFIVESAREKTKNKKSLAAIDGVLLELKRDKIDYVALRKARAASAAASPAYAPAAAAYAAYAAADASAASADAADAADAAASADAAAAYAASAAAYAASAAAYAASPASPASADAASAAARSSEYVKLADKLLELIRECK